MKKFTRRLLQIAVACVAVLVGGSLMLVSAAKVEATSHGVHKRLLVPLLGDSTVALPIYSGTGDAVRIPGFLDGPIVTRLPGGGWSARWFCEDRVHRATGQGEALEMQCAGAWHTFPLSAAAVPAAVGPMPARLAVISDVEGNLRFLDAALARLGIAEGGQWRYGDGHLVVLGDSVDRGRDVFAVLWRFHGLSQQAQAAGGAVHVVLGNHEQYVLRSNFSRAHPEHRHAMMETGGYGQALARGTVIGDWLRDQPVMLKLGDVLFVHGGISPAVVDAGFAVSALNASSRDYWARGRASTDTVALESVFGSEGLTQYRGYLEALQDRYPLATREQVDAVLAAFSAERIVVAHTLVDRVESRHDGRVYAVDVNSEEASPEVLLFENGRPRVVDIGIPRHLAAEPSTLREISLFDAADRAMLVSMYREMRRMAGLPHPY